MRISMWIIYDEMQSFNAVNSILDGSCSITGFCIFSNDTPLSPEYMYIGNGMDFFGNKADDIILAHGHDYILVKNAEFVDVLNRVIYIFDKYKDWSRRIQDAMYSEQPFQAILDITHEVTGSPMFFGQKNMRIMAITRQYTSDQAFDEWNEMKRFEAIPLRLIERLKPLNIPAAFPDEVDPAVIPADQDDSGCCHYLHVIRIACYYNQKIWGHLFVFYKKEVIPASLFHLLRFVSESYEKLLHILDEKQTGSYYFANLANLLEGNDISSEDIAKLYYTLNWNESTSLFVYIIKPSVQAFDRMMFESVITNISERYPNTAVFPFCNSIVLVAGKTQVDEQGFENTLNQYISLGSFQCGRSLAFCDIENMAAYYEQAQYVIEAGCKSHEGINYFEDNAYSCLVKAFTSRIDWKCWILPSLIKLMEIDATQDTEYYKTLDCLLQNNEHYGNTAKALFIHRNTLTYRLAQIENHLGVDMHNSGIISYLKFCINLIKNNESELNA